MTSDQPGFNRRKFLKGAAAALLVAGCSGNGDDPVPPTTPPAPVVPEYINPVALAAVVPPPHRESNFLDYTFISKFDWEKYFEPTIGVLTDANHKVAVFNAFQNLRNNVFTAANGIESLLGYTPNMRTDTPDAASQGGIWVIANLLVATDPFTDWYNANGLGTDTKPDFAALFTDANASLSLDTMVQASINEYFGSSITTRNFTSVPYTARHLAVNISASLFTKFGQNEARPDFENVYSGFVTIKNPVLDTIDTNGVTFNADAYVTWTDNNQDDHSLIVRINHSSGNALDARELEAISKMEAARQNGTYFYHDVLYIDLSNPNTIIPNFRPVDWDSTSEGSIRYSILDAIDRADAGPITTTSSSSSTKFGKAMPAYSNPRTPSIKISYKPGVEDLLVTADYTGLDRAKYSLPDRPL
jgi:hypothetical protein